MREFKREALKLNKNLVCKIVVINIKPLYQIHDAKTGKQITDGDYRAVDAWCTAYSYLEGEQ